MRSEHVRKFLLTFREPDLEKKVWHWERGLWKNQDRVPGTACRAASAVLQCHALICDATLGPEEVWGWVGRNDDEIINAVPQFPYLGIFSIPTSGPE